MTIKLVGKYTSATIHHSVAEDVSVSQIYGMLRSPAITNPVHIMPDFHAGKGSVVGFTMKASNMIIPNIVGVDIGCGMLTAKITAPRMGLLEVDNLIRLAVPTGFSVNREVKLNIRGNTNLYALASTVGMDINRMELSVGSLGGGNHFIELGKSDDGDTYITIHSGSRNLGKMVAEYFQKLATVFSGEMPDVSKDLEYMPVGDYMNAMLLAQEYASVNRLTMLKSIERALGVQVLDSFSCVHNYIDPIDMIIRKGAVSARKGDTIILPFNREDGIWIMEGLGNPDWNYSAPHGAGRTMSRSKAKKMFTQEYVDSRMVDSGVFSTSNPIDESPDVYKSASEIQGLVKETAEFKFSIKPILNIKDGND